MYGRALRAAPDHPDALTLSGALALVQGRVDVAIQRTRRAIKLHPGHLDAYLHLAEALEKSGQAPEAIAVCRKALNRAPDFAKGHSRLAKLLADAGDNGAAIRHAEAALAVTPRLVEALCALGLGSRRLNRTSVADDAYREALRIAPFDVSALAGYASLLNEIDRTAEAARFYRLALERLPNNPLLLGGLARVFERDNDIASALALYDQALLGAPRSADLLHRRGCCLRDLGDFEGADAAFRQVLAASPDHAATYFTLARMKRLQDSPEVRIRLGRIAAAPDLVTRGPIEAGFALGEILDRAGEPDAAFTRFAAANRRFETFRSANGLIFDRTEMASIVTATDRDLAAEYARIADWANPTDAPVFVVGMPRSGTTLVHQICASHSRVVGAGELRAIHRIAQATRAHNKGLDHPSNWDAAFSRAQADAHAAELRRIGGEARRVVDKTPANLMHLGLISALYPNARVIWCRRDPRDVVVSNHLTYFSRGNLSSTDLGNCAFVTRSMDRLGAIWRRELNLPILEVVYEDIVAEPEIQTRRIIDFLELEWEPACLDFQGSRQAVTTPSSWQVRQPLYSSSIGRWRRYEKHLAPMFEALAGDD